MKDQALRALSGLWDAFPPTLRRRVLFATNDHFLLGVVGLVLDEAGRVLVLEHRFRTPWRWGLPGGFVQHGEPLGAALERELFEEIGLEIDASGAPIDVETNHEGRYVSIALEAKLRGAGGALDLSKNPEIVGGGFFAAADLPADTYPYHRALIERHLAGR